ncbi:MAG: MmcQ/YjbR family DNA-binding protein [Bacteroidetes bacterium]|nr:MmcQ/YjbR family DNA-binding protein [Bacteroidota bacterium]
MDVEFIRDYCLKLKGVEESFPFDENTLVFKVGGKMFLLLALDSNPISINVKCEPNYAVELREKYHFVEPGYHMNKKHWNTIVCEKGTNSKLVLNWILDSYNLVFSGLTKQKKLTLK